MSDAQQDMLFATFTSTVVDDTVAASEVRIYALNAHNPSLQRAQELVDWLIGTQHNVLVLTELRRGDGGRRIIASLEADGFTVICPLTDTQEQYTTLIAAKGFTVTPVPPPPFDPRVVVVDLTSTGGVVRIAGVYGPSNGMTAESSINRVTFQQRLLLHLEPLAGPRLCVVGDLNVVEPGHQPHLPAYAEHDYDFYRGLLALGAADAYRATHPDGNDHSWLSDRFGNQRLDHLLIADQLIGHLDNVQYDHEPRIRRISDHAAITGTIRWNTTPTAGS
jgi:exodeoxyribonuclease-3